MKTDPVFGIVDTGMEMMTEALAGNPKAAGILFGTQTTISAGEYRRKLVAAGITDARLISQPCPDLVGLIETDWRGEETARLIDTYVGEAAAALKGYDLRPGLFEWKSSVK
ncbi:MAG: hypothetical protein NTW38_09675 [Candidatus Aminicenantes bacterium]|nr:hypothetical protein [Candidatus Aminicenantes bacterium]